MTRTTLLLIEPDARTRLARVSALQAHFDVATLALGEETVRRVRKDRVSLVLLSLPRGTSAMEAALRTARVLKTDRRPPRVGLTDRWGRWDSPADRLELLGAEGYLAGDVSDAQLLAFARAVSQGGPTVMQGELARGLLDRLLRR